MAPGINASPGAGSGSDRSARDPQATGRREVAEPAPPPASRGRSVRREPAAVTGVRITVVPRRRDAGPAHRREPAAVTGVASGPRPTPCGGPPRPRTTAGRPRREAGPRGRVER